MNKPTVIKCKKCNALNHVSDAECWICGEGCKESSTKLLTEKDVIANNNQIALTPAIGGHASHT